jgi:hypothetical protein
MSKFVPGNPVLQKNETFLRELLVCRNSEKYNDQLGDYHTTGPQHMNCRKRLANS